MRLHDVKPQHKRKKSRRVGRGGKRGTYSGKGIKGQKARAGARIRPAIRDIMAKFPKQRGRAKHAFKSLSEKPFAINLKIIEKAFESGEIVSPATLLAKNLVAKKGGGIPAVKILGDGELTKKLYFQNVLLSASARVKIEKTGGNIRALSKISEKKF